MKQSAPLSKTQYGIYAECVQHLGEYCYNITFLYTLDGSLDEARLKVAIESVVAAHPTLFTRTSTTVRRSAWRWSMWLISKLKNRGW